MPEYQLGDPLHGYTDQPPPSSMQSIAEMYAALEAYRAEHGPFLREIRCGAKVVDYLREKPPATEVPTVPSVMSASVPIIDDSDVPPGYARQVFDDGSTRDIQLLRFEINPEAVADMLKVSFPAIRQMGIRDA